MKKAISVKRKKPGRPATGTEPLYGIRISDDLMGRIQKWGRENSATRSDAIRRLVELGLKAKEKRPEESRARREAESISGTPTIQKRKLTPRIKPEAPKKL